MTVLTMLDGASICAATSGAGRPLVFIHGWAMNGGHFEPQRRAFSKSCKVVTFDLRGHGRSSEVRGDPTIEMLASDLCEVFEKLSLRDAICVGWSMGAMVMWAAMSDPSFARRVSALVSIDMSPRISNDASWTLGLRDGRRPLETIKAIEAMRADWPSVVERFVPRIFAAGEETARSALIEQVVSETSAHDPEVMASLWESMSVQDFRERLRALDVPMLAVHGEKSQLYSSATGEFVAQSAPHARLVKLRNSGHAPHLEEPEEFNKELSRFIEELESTATHHTPSVATAS